MALDETAPRAQSLAWRTLHDPDILDCLFEIFEYSPRGETRRTLAWCALVCKSWLDPASRVLWRRLDSFHPLWALLAGRNFPPSAKRLTEFWRIVDSEDFVKERFMREPDLWNNFLRRASHVREIGTASCHLPELMLLRSIIKHNGQSTFLPNLQKIGWRSGITTDTTLLSLVSPALRDLELDVTVFTTITTIGGDQLIRAAHPDSASQFTGLFAGLAEAAPFLTHLIITGRHVTSSIVLPALTGLDRLCELSLHGQIDVSPEELRSLLNRMTSLRHLGIRLRDFSAPRCSARTDSLRSLRVNGVAQDLGGLFASFLEAPHLTTLTLDCEDQFYTASHQNFLDALTKASFAPSLRKLTLCTLTEHSVMSEATSLGVLLQPLAAFRSLEEADLTISDPAPWVGDADILALAQAWPRLQRLALLYLPADARFLPPLTSLRHFAAHCPQLRRLLFSRMTVPGVVLPWGADRPGHPLQELDLRLTFVGMVPYDVSGIARFLDALFPNLELREEEVGRRGFAAITGTWDSIQREIRKLRGEDA